HVRRDVLKACHRGALARRTTSGSTDSQGPNYPRGGVKIRDSADGHFSTAPALSRARQCSRPSHAMDRTSCRQDNVLIPFTLTSTSAALRIRRHSAVSSDRAIMLFV